MTMTPQRPRTDADSLKALHHAIETLGRRRGRPRPLTDPHHYDPADALCLTQSLILQADHLLPEHVADAYDHGYTHPEIHAFLGLDHTPYWAP